MRVAWAKVRVSVGNDDHHEHAPDEHHNVCSYVGSHMITMLSFIHITRRSISPRKELTLSSYARLHCSIPRASHPRRGKQRSGTPVVPRDMHGSFALS